MDGRFRNLLKRNDEIYVLYKCLKNFRKSDLSNLLRSYYQFDYEGCIFCIEHPGTMMGEKIIYDISAGERCKTSVGFCAEMYWLLLKLKFAEEYQLIPRVFWGAGSPYYENSFEVTANNAFEYYFEPISEASKHSFSDFKNIIKSDTKHILKYQDMVSKSYLPDENNIHVLAEMFQRKIRLNKKTQEYIYGNIEQICKPNKRILGIHARGGDFHLGLKNHPHCVPTEEYLKVTHKEIADGNYDRVFLATDDDNILKAFIDNFGNNLLYYSDVPRVSGTKGVHLQRSSRYMHNYKLGLELLRDVYTLVSCDSFICGLSKVSFMVRYVKESLGERFNKVIILDEGINK